MDPTLPIFKKSCCCLPLRNGLLIWGYLRLLPHIYMILIILYENYFVRYLDMFNIVAAVVMVVPHIMNIFITFLLITATHKKSLTSLKSFYQWELKSTVINYTLTMVILVFLFITPVYSIALDWEILVGTSYLGIQLYVIVVARSEILRMEDQRLTVQDADAESKYHDRHDDGQDLQMTVTEDN